MATSTFLVNCNLFDDDSKYYKAVLMNLKPAFDEYIKSYNSIRNADESALSTLLEPFFDKIDKFSIHLEQEYPDSVKNDIESYIIAIMNPIKVYFDTSDFCQFKKDMLNGLTYVKEEYEGAINLIDILKRFVDDNELLINYLVSLDDIKDIVETIDVYLNDINQLKISLTKTFSKVLNEIAYNYLDLLVKPLNELKLDIENSSKNVYTTLSNNTKKIKNELANFSINNFQINTNILNNDENNTELGLEREAHTLCADNMPFDILESIPEVEESRYRSISVLDSSSDEDGYIMSGNTESLCHVNSASNGWKRAVLKMAGNDMNLSPIRQHVGNLLMDSSLPSDERMTGMLKLLALSEEFYYDNTLLLIKYTDDVNHLKNAIRINFQIIDYNYIKNAWSDISYLGSGAYGLVYKVTDKNTNKTFAVKYTTPKDDKRLLNHLLNYIKERNYILRAHDSPFVLKFINALSLKQLLGTLLIFETCLGDLSKILVRLHKSINPGMIKMIYDEDKTGINTLFDFLENKVNVDFRELLIIYIFEMFIMLDHLATCNIVHADIKPDNIMVGLNFHLKLGDFGLVNNMHFITEPTKLTFVNKNKLKLLEPGKYDNRNLGTVGYVDMENAYSATKKKDPNLIKNFQSIPINENDNQNNFLSDLWSMGVTILETITLGVPYTYPALIKNHKTMYYDQTAIKDGFYAILYLFAIPANKDKLINGLKNTMPFFKGIPEILDEIFKPRQERALQYTQEKKVYDYNKLKTMRHFDLSTIENLEIFQSIGITKHNAHLYDLPRDLERFYRVKQTNPIDFDGFMHKLIELDKDKAKFDYTQQNAITFKPGVNLNIF